jgi:hypothetical protein
MRNGRRTFLGLAVSGLGALAGLVLPGKANACRHRIICNPVAIPPQWCPPVPLQETPPPAGMATSGVFINFPQPSQTVYGDGGFYVWGYIKNATLGSASVLLNDGLGGAVAGVAATAPTPDSGEKTWAFLFNSVPTGTTTLTLAVPFTTSSGSSTATTNFISSV